MARFEVRVTVDIDDENLDLFLCTERLRYAQDPYILDEDSNQKTADQAFPTVADALSDIAYSAFGSPFVNVEAHGCQRVDE